MHSAEWKEVLMKKPKPSPTRIDTWEAPPTDWVLINNDGSFLINRRRGGWGAVGRDSDGYLVGAVQYASDALQTEATAMLHGIQMVTQLGIWESQIGN
jgi:hypothetical protein